MKKYLFALAALSLIFACTPENNNNGGGSQNNPEELTITGDALDVTDCSATLTGYANLPFELGDAEVGIMYDKVKSFEAAKKVVATGLDGNNKFTVTAAGYRDDTGLSSVGSYGSYWSSSLRTVSPDYAWNVGFNSDDVGRYVGNRYYGRSVRPVSE